MRANAPPRGSSGFFAAFAVSCLGYALAPGAPVLARGMLTLLAVPLLAGLVVQITQRPNRSLAYRFFVAFLACGLPMAGYALFSMLALQSRFAVSMGGDARLAVAFLIAPAYGVLAGCLAGATASLSRKGAIR